MNKGQAPLHLKLARVFIRVVKCFAVQYNRSAYTLRLHHFYRGCGNRHDNGNRHAQTGSVIAEPLRMIAS